MAVRNIKSYTVHVYTVLLKHTEGAVSDENTPCDWQQVTLEHPASRKKEKKKKKKRAPA